VISPQLPTPVVNSSQLPPLSSTATPHQYFGPLVTSTTSLSKLPQKLQLPLSTTPSTFVNPSPSSTTPSFLGNNSMFVPTVTTQPQQPHPQPQQQPAVESVAGPIFGPTVIGKQPTPSTPSLNFTQQSSIGDALILGPKAGHQSKLQTQQQQPQQQPQHVHEKEREREPHQSIDFGSRTWSYKVKGIEHGPFPGKQMQVWLDKSYFDITLEVRLSNAVPPTFSTLASWFIKDRGGY